MDGSMFCSDSLNRLQPQTTYQPAEEREAVLTRVVREQIIPTLLRRVSACAPGLSLAVEQLAALCLRGDAAAVVASVVVSFQNDQNAERLCRDLLTPTARYLGKCWEEDRCTFLDVTLGVAYLETALRAVQPLFRDEWSSHATKAHRVLLMPVPGGQHSFGLSMLASFFTRAGWDASIARVDRCQDLTELLAAKPADVIGFSVSHSELLDTARDAIALVRAVAGERAPVILIGGPMLVADPSLAGTLGADGTAINAVSAVRTALKLTRSTARRKKSTTCDRDRPNE